MVGDCGTRIRDKNRLSRIRRIRDAFAAFCQAPLSAGVARFWSDLRRRGIAASIAARAGAVPGSVAAAAVLVAVLASAPVEVDPADRVGGGKDK